MGKKHLPELIFVVVLVFSYDSIILENIYVFYHIFRLFIGIKKAIALRYSTWRGLSTGGIGDSFILLPRIFVVLGVFCARFPPREASTSTLLAKKNLHPKSSIGRNRESGSLSVYFLYTSGLKPE